MYSFVLANQMSARGSLEVRSRIASRVVWKRIITAVKHTVSQSSIVQIFYSSLDFCPQTIHLTDVADVIRTRGDQKKHIEQLASTTAAVASQKSLNEFMQRMDEQHKTHVAEMLGPRFAMFCLINR